MSVLRAPLSPTIASLTDGAPPSTIATEELCAQSFWNSYVCSTIHVREITSTYAYTSHGVCVRRGSSFAISSKPKRRSVGG